MITRYKHKTDLLYGVHDTLVSKISFLDEKTVRLQFDEGFFRLEEPYPKVVGNITIEKVDADFADVLLLSEDGKYGKFTGYKLSLKEFINQYDDYSFEIVGEMYGYNNVEYSGFLKLKDKDCFIEIILSIYYFGDIVYETNEP